VVSGTWELDYVGPGDPTTAEQDIGPQIGRGDLERYGQGTSFSINLNKGWADNNVFLYRVYEGTSLKGQRGWSTFFGERTNGTFVANQTTP